MDRPPQFLADLRTATYHSTKRAIQFSRIAHAPPPVVLRPMPINRARVALGGVKASNACHHVDDGGNTSTLQLRHIGGGSENATA